MINHTVRYIFHKVTSIHVCMYVCTHTHTHTKTLLAFKEVQS